jgi:hypothetical protein
MRSLHVVHEMNAYRAGHVSVYLSVCMIQLKKHYPKIVLFNFSTTCNINMAEEQTCEVGSTLVPLAIGPQSDIWL